MMISVIIPAYQCADTIENTVNSILASGLSDLEIIMIDDGSGDGTAEICDSLAEKHTCIRCYHQKNAGVSAARNKGLKEATGEYIWFFDADDSVDRYSMRHVDEVLAAEEPDMLVFGLSFDYFYRGKRFRRDERIPPMEGLIDAAFCTKRMYELFVTNSLSSLWSRIIKRSIILHADLTLREDMFLYEDLEFTLRVWKYCDSVFFIREPIYRYRQAEDGGNAGRRLMRIAHIPDLLDQIEAVLEGVEDKNRILLALYLTLAREKISVTSLDEIRVVCLDFKNWIDVHGLLPEIRSRKYAMLIYEARVIRLIAKRNISKIRHRLANWVKRTVGDFRKWQFSSGREGKQ